MVQLGEQHRRQCNFSGREEKDGGNVDGHTDEVLCIIIITTGGTMGIWTDHDPHILQFTTYTKGCCWVDHPASRSLHLLSPPSCLASHPQLQWGERAWGLRQLPFNLNYSVQPFTLVAKENVKLLTSEGCFRRAYKARKAGTFLSIGSLTGLECQGATVLAKLISTTFVLFFRVKLGRRTERRRTQAEEEDEAQVDLSSFFETL